MRFNQLCGVARALLNRAELVQTLDETAIRIIGAEVSAPEDFIDLLVELTNVFGGRRVWVTERSTATDGRTLRHTIGVPPHVGPRDVMSVVGNRWSAEFFDHATAQFRISVAEGGEVLADDIPISESLPSLIELLAHDSANDGMQGWFKCYANPSVTLGELEERTRALPRLDHVVDRYWLGWEADDFRAIALASWEDPPRHAHLRLWSPTRVVPSELAPFVDTPAWR